MESKNNSEAGPVDNNTLHVLPELKRKATSTTGYEQRHRKSIFARKLDTKVLEILDHERMLLKEQIGVDVDHKGETPTPTAPVSQKVLAKYQADKRALLDLDDQCGYECDELSYKEKIAENKLDKLRQEMFEEDLLLVNRPYFESYKKI